MKNKVRAKKDTKAFCPSCNKELIPKCGQIKIWHWSHKSLVDCDSWNEGETMWHLGWKNLVDKKNCEVTIGKHRADIFINNKVIELQNSSISSEEIIEREKFYVNMVWLFNATNWGNNIDIYTKEGYYSFRWKHPRKSLWYIKKPLFLDLGDEFNNQILHIKKIHYNLPCRGWGYLLTKKDFIRRHIKKNIFY